MVRKHWVFLTRIWIQIHKSINDKYHVYKRYNKCQWGNVYLIVKLPNNKFNKFYFHPPWYKMYLEIWMCDTYRPVFNDSISVDLLLTQVWFADYRTSCLCVLRLGADNTSIVKSELERVGPVPPPPRLRLHSPCALRFWNLCASETCLLLKLVWVRYTIHLMIFITCVSQIHNSHADVNNR